MTTTKKVIIAVAAIPVAFIALQVGLSSSPTEDAQVTVNVFADLHKEARAMQKQCQAGDKLACEKLTKHLDEKLNPIHWMACQNIYGLSFGEKTQRLVDFSTAFCNGGEPIRL